MGQGKKQKRGTNDGESGRKEGWKKTKGKWEGVIGKNAKRRMEEEAR